MRRPTYIYNPETCHYEPARVTWRDVVIYLSGLAVTAGAFFFLIAFIHNHFIETSHERELRAENAALEQHMPVLISQLQTIESTLSTLQKEENALHTQLFNEPPATVHASSSGLSTQNLLTADVKVFGDYIKLLQGRTEVLKNKSLSSKARFYQHMHIGPKDLRFLATIPSIHPISGVEADALASGFGKRINPFHKGVHQHPGVDFVAPRGTRVMATAQGTVTAVSKSNLQAGYGNAVLLSHSEGFATRYAHLEDIYVKPGQAVTKGMIIGTVGNSGGSVAPHLHYEVMLNDEHIDPLPYFMEGITSRQHAALVARNKKTNQSLD